MDRNPYPGKLIVFEGLDGSGQTTQAHLLADWFRKTRGQLAYYTKEPTDGPVGALLKLALSHRLSAPGEGREFKPLDSATMALFFAADRMDHLNNDIIPKLKNGINVIADRYYHSSFAYQSLEMEVDWIREINEPALMPDITFFLEVPPRICLQRMHAQRWHVELYEDLATLEKVENSYQQVIQHQRRHGERIEEMDANQPVVEVHRQVVQLTKDLLKISLTNRNHKGTKEQKELKLVINAAPLSEGEIAARREG